MKTATSARNCAQKLVPVVRDGTLWRQILAHYRERRMHWLFKGYVYGSHQFAAADVRVLTTRIRKLRNFEAISDFGP